MDDGRIAAYGSPGSGSSVAWVLNNHDMPRSVTRYGDGAPGVDAGDVDLGTVRARAGRGLLMLALPAEPTSTRARNSACLRC